MIGMDAQGAVVIRLAIADDAAAIHAGLMMIADHLGSGHKVTSTVADIRIHGFGPSPAFEVLIAESDGRFAGMCLFFRSFSTWRGRSGAYIQDLVVDEALRGRGVALALLRRTARHVRDQGGTFLRLSVDAGNTTAQRFYERVGMAPQLDERLYAAYGDAFDVLAGIGESGV